MKFRTEYQPSPAATPINPERGVLLLGSCFADNIGSLLRRQMVNASVNPTGTLFNPQSIANVIHAALDGSTPEFENHDGLWNSWLLPGEFSDTDLPTAENKAAHAIASLKESIAGAGTIIITFGTAIVYALSRPPFNVVSNCHRRPANTFLRDMLPVEAIVAAWDKCIERIRRTNPRVRFIFTVSPVRHIKEGFHANTLSKSTLQLAIAALARLHPDCEYFPAYEILIDDLRGYRFTAADMQHPTAEAAEYIYEKFSETYFTPETRALLQRADKLRRRIDHRPLHPDTPQAAQFADETTRQLNALLAEAPFLRP